MREIRKSEKAKRWGWLKKFFRTIIALNNVPIRSLLLYMLLVKWEEFTNLLVIRHCIIYDVYTENASL
ncbi:hypothetical protein BDZ91DRAFT_740979 [Kalaharituber pfeilii]|nr:hypothetical protein BDZ91DRAFT_740979 [Kalaharituber pfeilii]